MFSLQFIKTPKFLSARNWEGYDPTENDVLFTGPSAPPGLGSHEELGGAHMTVSQYASEREHRQQIQQRDQPAGPSSP
jgi:GTPase-activating protein SST2